MNVITELLTSNKTISQLLETSEHPLYTDHDMDELYANPEGKVYMVKDLSTEETLEWNFSQILAEINKDHSEEWTPYDSKDWVEGWAEWVEGDGLYTLEGVR